MKITDKQRLDWLNKQRGDIYFNGPMFPYFACFRKYPENEVGRGKTPRAAIDAAIKAERKPHD